MNLGDLIMNRRKALGYTRQEFADRLNVSVSVVAGWESNLEQPSGEEFLALAKLLSMPVEELKSGINESDTESKEEGLLRKHRLLGKKNIIIRILGPILIIVAFIMIGVTMVEFANYNPDLSKGDIPRPNFGLLFVALPCLFVGSVLTIFGNLGRTARFAAKQYAPIASDLTNFMHESTRASIVDTFDAIRGKSQKRKCSSCGQTLTGQESFCSHCGNKLNKECTNCGTENSDAARFCISCGNKM